MNSRDAKKAFFQVLAVCAVLGLNEVEKGELLRMPDVRNLAKREFTRHECERVSAIVGIVSTLKGHFTNTERTYAWLTIPNIAKPFSGRTPLALMMGETNDGLFQTWRYVQTLCEGNLVAIK